MATWTNPNPPDWTQAPPANTQERRDWYTKHNLKQDHTTDLFGSGGGYSGYSSAQDAYNEGFGSFGGTSMGGNNIYNGGTGNQTSPQLNQAPDYLYDDSDITFVDNNDPTNTFNPRGDNMDTQYNIKGFDYSSPAGDQFGGGNNSQPNPAATAGIIRGAAGVMQGLIGREGRRNAQIEAQDAYDDLLSQYRNLDTSNIYADVENFFAENVYEDLTVNKQQAEFEKEMFERQQANIMSNLAGAAGGSGIASLAQAMANQSQIQAQRAAGTIGMQESRNQMLRAQGALQVQKGEMLAEQMRLQGAERARALEYQQTATQLGMSQQDLAAANQAQAQGNAALWGGIGSIAGGIIGGPIGASIGGKLFGSGGGMIGGQSRDNVEIFQFS